MNIVQILNDLAVVTQNYSGDEYQSLREASRILGECRDANLIDEDGPRFKLRPGDIPQVTADGYLAAEGELYYMVDYLTVLAPRARPCVYLHNSEQYSYEYVQTATCNGLYDIDDSPSRLFGSEEVCLAIAKNKKVEWDAEIAKRGMK